MSDPSDSATGSAKIFISYRREDCAGHAGRLFDRLCDRFGSQRIFMDVDSIEPGEDFEQVIDRTVGACQVLIAVIGRSWLTISADEKPRLHQSGDFVRLEIATALRREIRVIPVLVQGATMPSAEELPDDLKRLVRRNALDVDDLHWNSGIDRLIGTIEKILGEDGPAPTAPPAKSKKSPLRLLALLGAILVVAGIAIAVFRGPPSTRQSAEEFASAPAKASEGASKSAAPNPTEPSLEALRRTISVRADRSAKPTDALPDGRTRHLYSIWIEAPPTTLRKIAKVQYHYDHHEFESPRTERTNPSDGFRDSYNGIGAVNADMDVVVVLWDGTEMLFKFNMYQAIFGPAAAK